MNPAQRVAQQYVDQKSFCSIEWAVKHRGDLVESGTTGYADASEQTPVPDNAIYRIYSMTKPIVSIAALMLIERNALQLYDPVEKFVPAFKTQDILHADGTRSRRNVVTSIEHLLTHQAGLSYDFLPECPVAEQYRDARLAEDGSRTLTDLVKLLGELPVAFEPGSAWCYSYATDVLAHVLEVICSKPLDEILRELVLDPLAMHDTAFSVVPANSQRLMKMYGASSLSEVMAPPEGAQILSETNVEHAYPAAPNDFFRRGGLGLYSTTRDYLRFCEFLHQGKTSENRRLLSSPMVTMMWSNRLPDSDRTLRIGPSALPGYGWNLFGRVMLDVGQSMGLTGHGEGGWAGAAATYFWVDRANQLSGVVMTQYLGSSIPMASELRAAVYTMLDDFK